MSKKSQNTIKTEVSEYKRDLLFLGLSAVFLTALVMGNIIGTTKFVQLLSLELPRWMLVIVPELIRDGGRYDLVIPVGLLAFPLTFFVTDLISELFGRKKAQMLVWVGLIMNVFMFVVMTINYHLPDAAGVSGGETLFEGVYSFMVGNTIGSMIAYLIAQTIDVRLFHFWKRATKGKHLWLRNNASTMISQLVDSSAILSILYFAGNLGDSVVGPGALIILILNSYLFKFLSALLDTPFCYAAVYYFRDYYEDPSGYELPIRSGIVTNRI
ncbi:MAG: queuosine precursor transporter [Balneolales bacterium]